MSTPTNITEVGTVVIPVTDQDRALSFYTEKLGFEVHTDAGYGEGTRWIEVAPKGGATTIALSPPEDGAPVGIETNVSLTTTDVDADHAALREAGVQADEVMRMGDSVPPMFFFKDPDGNRLVIVQEH
jgi:catechol 2,3-dioxygenase-like lactoylglutathione lyase family enzyme